MSSRDRQAEIVSGLGHDPIPQLERMDVLDGGTTMPDAAALTIADGILYYLTSVNGGAVLRRARLQK